MTVHSTLPSPSSSQPDRVIENRSVTAGLDAFSCWVYTMVALAMLTQAGWVLWAEYN